MIFSIFMFAAIVGNLFVKNHIYVGRRNFAVDELIERRLKKYCLILGTALFLIAALRSEMVGSDTRTYIGHYEYVKKLSWSAIPQVEGTELGFYFLMKLVSMVTDNAQWFLALVGVVYAASVTNFIIKNSKEPDVSFIMLISFSYYAFSLTGLRQTMAFAIMIFAFEYVKKRKLLPFLISVIVAFAFHRSAVFALLTYFLYGIKMTKGKRALFLAAAPIVYVMRYPIIKFLQQWFYAEYKITESTVTTWATLAVLFLTWVVYVAFSPKVVNEADQNTRGHTIENDGGLLKNTGLVGGNIEAIYLVGVIIQMFVPFEPTIFRVGMYYQVYGLLLVPEIIHSERLTLSSKRLVKAVYVALMLVMYFRFTYYAAAVNPYHFFWET